MLIYRLKEWVKRVHKKNTEPKKRVFGGIRVKTNLVLDRQFQKGAILLLEFVPKRRWLQPFPLRRSEGDRLTFEKTPVFCSATQIFHVCIYYI